MKTSLNAPARLALWAVGAAALLLIAPAQAMPVSEFVARSKAVEKFGIFAQLAPDTQRLAGALREALKNYRADVERSAAEGKPISCPPPDGQAKIEAKPLLDYLSRLSPAQQKMELKDAVYAYLAKTYPCP
ncbi:hypothetical protein [Brucella sp. IR073]|uniref:hypothetical protein n=1 Tax=unclassified Brucella TaxID=2632610 RepID=UPI003B98395C